MEIWKEVQGHPDYKISSSGKIWSDKTNKELVIDYGIVMLDGEPAHFATLMGIHFIDGYRRGMTLFRKDSTVPDWSVDNLQLITPEEVFRSAEHIEKIKNENELIEKKIQETDFEISKLNSIEFEVNI